MIVVDRCKVCHSVTVHNRTLDGMAREWWRCGCGAVKHLLSKRAEAVDVGALVVALRADGVPLEHANVLRRARENLAAKGTA